MDMSTQLKCSSYLFISTKVVRTLFQLGFTIYLAIYGEYDAATFTAVSGAILSQVLVSYFWLVKRGEMLLIDNVHYSEYLSIIIMECTDFIITFFGYVIAIGLIEAEYKDDKEKLYFVHHEPFVNKSQDLQSGLVSVMSMKKNSPELTDSSFNDYHMMNQTSLHEPSKEMFEQFYFTYVTLQLVTLSLIGIITQLSVVCALALTEYVKYKIRKVRQVICQELAEMGVMGINPQYIH